MTTQSAILGKALAEPQSLAEERLVNAILSDAPESADTSEGNLMSLKLLKSLYDKSTDDDVKDAIDATIVSESKYLIQAMKLLNGDAKRATQLVGKFGRGLSGAVALSKVLKTKADEMEINELLSPSVSELISVRKGGGKPPGINVTEKEGKKQAPLAPSGKE